MPYPADQGFFKSNVACACLANPRDNEYVSNQNGWADEEMDGPFENGHNSKPFPNLKCPDGLHVVAKFNGLAIFGKTFNHTSSNKVL